MGRRFGLAVVVTAVLVAAAVGMVSYNAGVSHGLAIGTALTNAPAGAVGPYGWYRPWGFGFGFGPFFLVLCWFVLFRMFFWGGMHRRRWYAGEHGAPQAFEEWHRRAHERMNGQPTPEPHSEPV